MNVKIEYQFTRGDYIAVLRQIRRFGFTRLWIVHVLLLAAIWGEAGTIAFFMITRSDYSPISLILISFISIFGVLFAFDVFCQTWIIARFIFPLLRVANRTVQMVFDDFGIHTKLGEIEGRIPWNEIRRFVQTPEALFLFVSQKLAYIIPLRTVTNAASLGELADAIRAKLPEAAQR